MTRIYTATESCTYTDDEFSQVCLFSVLITTHLLSEWVLGRFHCIISFFTSFKVIIYWWMRGKKREEKKERESRGRIKYQGGSIFFFSFLSIKTLFCSYFSRYYRKRERLRIKLITTLLFKIL